MEIKITNLSRKNWKTTAPFRQKAFTEGTIAYPHGKNPYIKRTYMSKEFNDGFFYKKGYVDALTAHIPLIPEKSSSYNSYIMGWEKRKNENEQKEINSSG